ncbi:hypothetical protein [uncultured Pelagimonas sp.]|uniref:hypothetical protein n=1 Tax=uncultured Pelagimonas sp. TaxID=1618102 RepID=UPI00263594A6|nr:hypothetical protein [uncultured Pelagimonas sp.]
MLLMIPFFAFLMGLILGYAPVRACRSDVTWGYAGLLVALGGLLLFKEVTVPGLDGVIYTLVGLFVVTPSLIATLIGAGVANLRPREMC